MSRPLIAVILIHLVLVFGTAGYMLIESWPLLDSLYMTVITLATVGYGEIREISQLGRAFTMVLILMGVGLFMYVGGSLIQFLVEGKIREILGRRKLEKQISKLKDHFIVCGYGRIGRVLCRFLTQRYLDVVVIEKNEKRLQALNEDGVLYIIGEATDENNLMKAGISHARALLTALATDADNVFLVLMAKQHNPNLFVVARAGQNATKKTLVAAGADKVISPYDLGARRMAHAILRPTVIHFLELAFADDQTDIQMEEVQVSEKSGLVGKELMDSGIRQEMNLIILTIKKLDGHLQFNPSAHTIIEAGDTLVAVGDSKNLSRLARLLRPS